MTMKILVKKWGNSASVRIPAAVMQAAHLELDQPVDVREQDGKIIIEPIRKSALSLDVLLSGITPENCHDSVEFGPAEGSEIW